MWGPTMWGMTRRMKERRWRDEKRSSRRQIAGSREEVFMSKELNHISRLTEGILQAGEGKNAMLQHMEKMAEDLVEKETGTREALRLAKPASNVFSSSVDPLYPEHPGSS